MKRYTDRLFRLTVVTLAALITFGAQAAEAGVRLGDVTYYGGSGNEYAFGAAAANGGLYIAGSALVSGYYQGLGLFYSPASSASPTWDLTWPDTAIYKKGDYLKEVSATSTSIYFAGSGASRATDNVGDFEGKSLLASFPLTGATGAGLDGSNWYRSPNVYSYSGGENFQGVITDESQDSIFAVGNGETYGWGRNAAYAFRYDSSGNEIWRKVIGNTSYTDYSNATSVVQLSGKLYIAGVTQYPYNNAAAENATLWSLDPVTGNINWQKTTTGYTEKLVTDGTSLFAAGHNGSDALILAYDDAGNILWRTEWGGTGIENANSLLIDGDRIYVVGETNSYGTGGYDAFLLEVSALTGKVLDSAFWGGTGEDRALDVELIGKNELCLVGYTDSYGSGGKDVFLLQAKISDVPEPVTVALLSLGLVGLAGIRRKFQN